jgi:serine protease Do
MSFVICLVLALAPSRPPLASQIPAIRDAGRVYEVPFRLTPTKHILVRAKINGKGPYNFVLDTGAPDLFVASTKL